MHRGGKRDAGQALVETAIVMPLYVFLLLGLLQLGLMHQARLMTKYAAYQAARSGALHNANVSQMEKAALGVLLPLASSKHGQFEVINAIKHPSDYGTKWDLYQMNLVSLGLKIAKVTICGPVRSDLGGGSKGEVDFDDPKYDVDVWKTNQATKLRVQVTFNYRMPIPFANAVIDHIWWGTKITSVLHLGKPPYSLGISPKFMLYETLANTRHIYVMPIRAAYNMRMQSNIYLSNIPKKNECVVPWSFKK